MCTASDKTLNSIQEKWNECKNTIELVNVMSKYIKDQYHLDQNEMSLEAVNITDVSTRTE